MNESSNSQFHKTKLCRYFQNSRCFKGEECSHAHTREELVERPDLRKTSLCHVWMKTSQCSMDSKCPYAHGRDELRSPPSPRVRSDSSSASPSVSRLPRSPISYSNSACEKRMSFPRRSCTTETRCSVGDASDETWICDSDSRSPSPVLKGSLCHDKSGKKSSGDRSRRTVTLTPFHSPPSFNHNHSFVYPPSLSAVSECAGFWPQRFYYPSYIENVSSFADGEESLDTTPKSLIEFPIIC